MRSGGRLTRTLALALGVLIPSLAIVPCAIAAEEKRYVTTTVRGTLTIPGTGKPMAGAVLRFVPTDPDLPRVEAVTDVDGRFAAEGLAYGIYAVEIETAAGQLIRGINALPIREGEPVEITLKLSDRVRSSTSVENQPEQFMAVVKKERKKWKRFWKEFAVFLGVAAASGAAF